MHSSTEGRARPGLRNGSRRWLAFLSVVAMSLVGGLATIAVAPAANAAEVTNGLVLRYKLDEQSGTVAADSSGKGRNGTVNGTATWGGDDGLAFNGSDTYIKVPDNIMAGLTSISVTFDVLVDPGLQPNYFIYGFGNTNAPYGNGYLFTTGDGAAGFRTTIATGNWSTEQNTAPAPARNLQHGVWKHLVYTLANGTGVLYEDGAQAGIATGITTDPSLIGGGKTTADYIGRSVYSGDNLFKGKIRDFRLYDRALSGSEVSQLLPTAAQNVARDKATLGLGDLGAVADNLSLPSTGPNGSTITWASSNTAIVANNGTVTRPSTGQPDATVTLTATLTNGGVQQTRAFAVTVLANLDDSQKTLRAAKAIALHGIDDVRDNITLPTSGDYGTKIAWKSDRPAVISTDGVVERPLAGAGNTQVQLHATVTLNNASAPADFLATVREKPKQEALKGYLFSYFTGESPDGEQLRFSLSKGNDALHWRELNGGQPVLTSTLGDKGLRDPFIIRSPQGDKFYQIATDLRMAGRGNAWDYVQRHGSKSIMVWESTDLVHWTDQRLVQVAPDTAGNTWAPEAFYDPTQHAYVVFWASQIFANNDPDHTGTSYNRVMYSTTHDFRTFTEAKPYIDYKYPVIDTTMIEHNGTYYRFSKDERDPGQPSAYPGKENGKYVFEQKGKTVLGDPPAGGFDLIEAGIGRSKTGGANQIGWSEGPTVFKSNLEDKWYLFIDENGGRGYVPFETTDLESKTWKVSDNYELPKSPRHGTVLPVTQAEYDRLLRTYSPADFVDSVDDLTMRTPVRTAPTLPAQVTAHFADGKATPVDVKWDAVPPAQYAKPGTFTVSGTITQSETIRAKAVVTVYGEENPNAGPDISGAEGSAITLTGTVNGTPATNWNVTPKTGVDTGATCTVADPHATGTTLTCTDDGTYEVKLNSGEMSDTATVTVTNAPPKISGAQGPKDPVDTGAAAYMTAPFTDAGSNDTHTCKVDWADGRTSDGIVKDGKCTGSHTYADAGTYQATVTVTDDDGGTGRATAQVVVKTAGGISTPIGTLPVTGLQAALVAGAGAALLLLGGILLIVGRRRGRTRQGLSALGV